MRKPCLEATHHGGDAGREDTPLQGLQGLVRTSAARSPHLAAQVINPESSRHATYWQFVTFAAMIFVAFVTPIQVGLFPIRMDLLLAVSLCVDFVFLVDMVLQFFTMYPKRRSGLRATLF